MASRLRLIGLGALAAASVLAVAAQGVVLARKPVAGEEHKYSIKANLEFGGMEATLTATQGEKVLAIEPDGTYSVEQRLIGGTASLGGTDIDIPSSTPTVIVFTPKGAVKEIRGDSVDAPAYRFANLAVFSIPDKAVAVGDTWSYEGKPSKDTGAVAYKADYKIVGEEAVAGADAYKVEYTAKETEGGEPASATGTVWIAKSDAAMLKNVSKWANVPFPGAPGTVSGSVTITRQ